MVCFLVGACIALVAIESHVVWVLKNFVLKMYLFRVWQVDVVAVVFPLEWFWTLLPVWGILGFVCIRKFVRCLQDFGVCRVDII